MDRTSGFGPDDLGSIPSRLVIVLNQKSLQSILNPYFFILVFGQFTDNFYISDCVS